MRKLALLSVLGLLATPMVRFYQLVVPHLTLSMILLHVTNF
jgi:hypothetical protein